MVGACPGTSLILLAEANTTGVAVKPTSLTSPFIVKPGSPSRSWFLISLRNPPPSRLHGHHHLLLPSAYLKWLSTTLYSQMTAAPPPTVLPRIHVLSHRRFHTVDTHAGSAIDWKPISYTRTSHLLCIPTNRSGFPPHADRNGFCHNVPAAGHERGKFIRARNVVTFTNVVLSNSHMIHSEPTLNKSRVQTFTSAVSPNPALELLAPMMALYNVSGGDCLSRFNWSSGVLLCLKQCYTLCSSCHDSVSSHLVSKYLFAQ